MKTRRLISIVLLSILLLTVMPIAQASASTGLEPLFDPINAFISTKYSAIADLTESDRYYSRLCEKVSTSKALSFYETEELLLSAEITALKDLPDNENVRYQDYNLIIDFGKPTFKSEKEATVYASVVCKFHYEETPSILSEYGLIYRFDLEKNSNKSWEIVSRSYPGFFEQVFWEGDTPSYETAMRKTSLMSSHKANSTKKVTSYTPVTNQELETRGQVTYSTTARDNAALTALSYVAPNNYTWTDGSGYTYTYPTGYSQVKLDCTNFVSFCLNYSSGGNIPQDDTGTDKWKKGSYAWYNVDGFYSYFSASKDNSEKGFYGVTYYSDSEYPSWIIRSLTQKSDIIQFSSVSTSDWTHSAIVTSKQSNNTIFVCMHDAYSYYSECNLSSFYSATYPSGSPRYIRFLKIQGYYS